MARSCYHRVKGSIEIFHGVPHIVFSLNTVKPTFQSSLGKVGKVEFPENGILEQVGSV